MTEQERFQRAFAPLHAPSDTLTEVMKMTEQKHRKSGRRTAVIALAAALLLATGSAAYAADLGSIQRRVQLWLHGDQTDAVMTVEPGHYTLEYTDENGETQQRGGGGVAFEPDGTERPLTPEEIAEADAVILAVDIKVEKGRFEGKPTLEIPTSLVVKAPKQVIQKVAESIGK